MIWTSWRLQRTETLITIAILALIAALLVPTGIQIADAYSHAGLGSCVSVQSSNACQTAIVSFTTQWASLVGLVTWLTLIPGLIGVLLAAPFLLDLESGTYRLAWTQSITRRRWLAGKLGLAIACSLAASLVLVLLMTWWHAPWAHLQGRLDSPTYDFEGTVIFGYGLFALGLAVAVGAVWRKAVPALVVGFGGYFAARIFVDTWLRQHLVAPLSATWKAAAAGPNLNTAWVLSEGPSDKLGHYLGQQGGGGGGIGTAIAVPGRCVRAAGSQLTPCEPSGYIHAVYQPESHFWALQGAETALFGGIALLLIVFAAWWTHERLA
jgi:ABC-type transport system involved in multi-copper enzyme maturation permease subunit